MLHSSYPRHHRQQSGMTLLEVAIVLCMFSIVSAGVWMAAGNVHQKNKINELILEYDRMKDSIFSVYGSRGFNLASYGSPPPEVTTLETADTGAIMLDTTAVSPWMQPVKVFAVSAHEVRLSFYSLPEDACIALLSHATLCSTGYACPTQILTADAAKIFSQPGTGWSPTLSDFKTECDWNNAATTPSVEFQFKL